MTHRAAFVSVDSRAFVRSHGQAVAALANKYGKPAARTLSPVPEADSGSAIGDHHSLGPATTASPADEHAGEHADEHALGPANQETTSPVPSYLPLSPPPSLDEATWDEKAGWVASPVHSSVLPEATVDLCAGTGISTPPPEATVASDETPEPDMRSSSQDESPPPTPSARTKKGALHPKAQRIMSVEDVLRSQGQNEDKRRDLMLFLERSRGHRPEQAEHIIKEASTPKPSRRNKHPHQDPAVYDVPKMGDVRMPIVSPKPPPPFETFSRQIEKSLPAHLRDVPAPKYRFAPSKDKAKSSLRKPEPARNHRVPGADYVDDSPKSSNKQEAKFLRTTAESTIPTNESTTRHTAVFTSCKPIAEALSKDASQPSKVPTQHVSRASNVPMSTKLYASSVFSEEVEAWSQTVPHETRETLSRWHWFNKSDVSVLGSGDATEHEYEQKLSKWDKPHMDGAEWQHGDMLLLDPRGLERADKWTDKNAENHKKCPYSLDMDDLAFKSGDLPANGVRCHWQEFPPDLAYPCARIEYGPIDWNAIPGSKLTDPKYLEAQNFNQTSQGKCMEAYAAMLKAHAARKAKKEAKVPMKHRKHTSHGTPTIYRAPLDTAKAIEHPSNTWIPRMNIYIRPATDKDAGQIAWIYNHYVTKTLYAIEAERVTANDIKNLILHSKDVSQSRPFFVAINRAPAKTSKKSDTSQNRKQSWGRRLNEKKATELDLTEPVVGFSTVMNFAGRNSCFPKTLEQTVFVRPECTHQGIAKNLLDRSIGAMDIAWKSHRGVDIEVEPERSKWTNLFIRPTTIMINLFYKKFEEPELQGKKAFLEQEFGFVESANYEDICEKREMGRFSMMVMCKKTNRFR